MLLGVVDAFHGHGVDTAAVIGFYGNILPGHRLFLRTNFSFPAQVSRQFGFGTFEITAHAADHSPVRSQLAGLGQRVFCFYRILFLICLVFVIL